VSEIRTELLADVLRRATSRGATAADGFLIEETSFSASVRLGQVDTVTHSREQRLSLRVFAGRASAAASTSDLSRDSLERVVDEATALARVTAEDPHAGLPDPGELIERVPDLELEDREVGDPSPEEKIELARRAEAAALATDPRISNSEGAEYFDHRAHYAYATSHGFARGYATSSFGLSVSPVAGSNGDMQRDSWYTYARRRRGLEAPEAVGRTAAERALRRLDAKRVPTCTVPVVFEPLVARSLLGHLAGCLSGGAIYRQSSFLAGRIGRRIASELVTVIDDGRVPSGLGSRPFDGEGQPTRRNVVLENGTLRTYFLDSYSARKLGMASTGSAARGATGAPAPSSTNLWLEPGKIGPDEIIRRTERGLLVTELIGMGFNPVTGDYSRGAAGLWIEGGKVVHAVEEITIAGHLGEMLDAIDLVGSDLLWAGATAAPTLRIAQMTVAGA
jgi:PmbA protein